MTHIVNDSERFRWLVNLKANQVYLDRDGDHACNYMTASQWIDQNPDEFKGCSQSTIEAMKDTNTIWSLQIYPDTPVGFYMWYGPTAECVIDAAREELGSMT